MFNRHAERAQRRAALDERYAVLNAEKELQKRNLSERQMEEVREGKRREEEEKVKVKLAEEEKMEMKKMEVHSEACCSAREDERGVAHTP